jgi:hypothetical protein
MSDVVVPSSVPGATSGWLQRTTAADFGAETIAFPCPTGSVALTTT